MTNESMDMDKRFTFQDETGIELSGSAAIVDDARFGKCAHLSGSEARITLRSACSELGLHGENFTLSLWVSLGTDEGARLFLGTDAGVLRIGAGQIGLFAGDDARLVVECQDGEFVPGQWYHLAWTKAGDTHRFYLDGAFLEEKKADWSWRAEDILTLSGQGVCWVADLKCYARKLSDAEVRADYIAERPTAAETFTDHYPIDFAIANVDGPHKDYPDNKLFIVDSAGKIRVRQKIHLTNVSRRKIILMDTGNTTASLDNYHFEIRFRHATFSEPGTYPRLETGEGWSAAGPVQNSDDSSWSIFILSKEEQSLPPHESDASALLEFPLEYVSADAALGARGTGVALYYRNLAYGDSGAGENGKNESFSGVRNKQVDILNLSSSSPVIRKLNAEITKDDAEVDRLEIKNEEYLKKLSALIDGLHEAIPSDKTGGDKTEQAATLSAGVIKELFQGVGTALKTLAENIKAVDTEVDARAEATNAFRKMDKPFPLVVTYDAPDGVVCNDTNTVLNLILHNRSDEIVTFTKNAEFRFVVPMGDCAGDFAVALKSVGVGEPPLVGDGNASHNSYIFRWKPKGKEVEQEGTIEFQIKNCTPNEKPGTAIIDVEYQGVEGYPAGRLALGIVKTTRDLAKLAGGEDVGIGTDTPKAKLDVQGPIHAGGSDLYFTDKEHDHTGFGNTNGYAAIENAKNFDSLMILGRAGTDKGRKVRLWDYLQVNGSFEATETVKAKKFTIGDTEFEERELQSLKKLLASQVRVFLRSDYGEYVCDAGRKDRGQDGHSRFVIEFE